MSNPRDLEFLSHHLSILLGDAYQELSIAYHALRTRESLPALAVDVHREHLGILSGLIREDDASFMVENIRGVLTDCLPVYHVRYEENRASFIQVALEKVKVAIVQVRASHWGKRDLALEQFVCIQEGYEVALAKGACNIHTRS